MARKKAKPNDPKVFHAPLPVRPCRMGRAQMVQVVGSLMEALTWGCDHKFSSDVKEITPYRVVKSFEEMFNGYQHHPKVIFKVFEHEKHDQMIAMHNIDFVSTCEHHWLPFFGKAHIAYVPDGKVIGASKLVRLLEIYTKRFQIQERICTSVVEDLMEYLAPQGAACVLQARHLCVCARGVTNAGATFTTSCVKGVFRTEGSARSEFFSIINSSKL